MTAAPRMSSWFADNAPASSGTTGNPLDAQIQALYQQYLGRAASPEELAIHYGNPGGIAGITTAIQNSPEAQARPVTTSATVAPAATASPTGTNVAGTYTGGGQYPLASVMGEGLMQPWTTPFTAPTDVTEQNDPGFQFRLKEGVQALQRSAAAKGTLLTGGTVRDLNEWAQGFASNEYGDVYNRAKGEYDTAYGIFNNNQTNQFSRLNTMSSQGLGAAQSEAALQAEYNRYIADLQTQVANAQASGNVAATNATVTALTNATNAGLQAYVQSRYGTPPTTSATGVGGYS